MTLRTTKRSLRVSFRWMLILIVLASLMVLPARVLAQEPDNATAAWLGEYFANGDLLGMPSLLRYDEAIDFNWGSGAPADVLPKDNFSVRWTRSIYFNAGTYRFSAHSDDGVRVWLDGEIVIDQWHLSSGTTYIADRTLNSGYHALRVEYFEEGGLSKVYFWWDTLVAEPYPDWRGEYYANGSLNGSPVLLRNDEAIDFNWGQESPDETLPADGFSVRWTSKAYFEAATYRFHAVVDGSVCLWVGAEQVLDSWGEDGVREVVGEYTPARGEYWMKVEFFERAGNARILVWWEKVYEPYNPEPTFPDWRGQYWSNQDLEGKPTLVRNDEAIDFDWGNGAAAPGLASDKFSVRWDRRVSFEPGVYVFYAQADNGIRLYVDGELILNEWYTNSERVNSVASKLEGSHHLCVEYYDNGGPAMAKFWWE